MDETYIVQITGPEKNMEEMKEIKDELKIFYYSKVKITLKLFPIFNKNSARNKK
jgi:hypothetical protein